MAGPKKESLVTDDEMESAGCAGAAIGAATVGPIAGIVAVFTSGALAGLIVAALASVLGAAIGVMVASEYLYREERKRRKALAAKEGD